MIAAYRKPPNHISLTTLCHLFPSSLFLLLVVLTTPLFLWLFVSSSLFSLSLSLPHPLAVLLSLSPPSRSFLQSPAEEAQIKVSSIALPLIQCQLPFWAHFLLLPWHPYCLQTHTHPHHPCSSYTHTYTRRLTNIHKYGHASALFVIAWRYEAPHSTEFFSFFLSGVDKANTRTYDGNISSTRVTKSRWEIEVKVKSQSSRKTVVKNSDKALSSSFSPPNSFLPVRPFRTGSSTPSRLLSLLYCSQTLCLCRSRSSSHQVSFGLGRSGHISLALLCSSKVKQWSMSTHPLLDFQILALASLSFPQDLRSKHQIWCYQDLWTTGWLG